MTMEMIERIDHYWRVIKGKKRPFRFILSRILVKLGISKFLTVYRGGYKILFFPTALSEALWIDAKERLGDESFFIRYLKAGDNVIDVGSNIGTLTLKAASLIGEKGKVVSIEPHPRTFTFLSKNIHSNPFRNVDLINVAVGDKGGFVNISNKKPDDINRVVENSGGIKVRLSRLDEIIDPEMRIALLKIDVEGYERFVISGAEDILKNVDCIYFESWEESFNNFGYSTTDIIKLINEKGFEVYKVLNGNLKKLNSCYTSVTCENLIAIKNLNDLLGRTCLEVKKK